MEKTPCFLVGKLSSHFNPCLNTCLEASWCIVFPQQAAPAASACSLHGTAVGPVLGTHAPAVPGVKQQLCFMWGKGSALMERHSSSLSCCPDQVPLVLQEGLISPRFQPEGPRTGSPPPWPLCKEQPCSCLLAGNGASLAENGSAFAQKIPTVNELPEITILKQVLAVLYKLRSVCVVLKRHRGMCCSFHAK